MLLRLHELARDIKIAHSVFALPFALLAAFLATAVGGNGLPRASSIALIVLCMVLARTVAMAVNRWADAALDARNPRTADRAIPAGRLTRRFVLAVAAACAGLFVMATAGFWLLDGNPWPLGASPLVLAWLAGYSFTKRFTWTCHLFLGAALALSPIAASLAIDPAAMGAPGPYLLAAMVLCWVAGFDVFYALGDVDADRRTAVHSLPARLGRRRALVIAAALHVLCVAALVLLALAAAPWLGAAFAVGIVVVTILLATEHALLWRSGTRHLDLAFFTLNGLISLLLGGLGIVDIVRCLVAQGG